MGHSITVQLIMSEAQEIQELGRKIYNDDSLGINQSVLVVLRAIASGEYKLAKARKTAEKKIEPGEKEE